MPQTEINVPSLHGGVCKLSPSKALPNEVLESVNGQPSRERSWERRAPLELVPELTDEGELTENLDGHLSFWTPYPTRATLENSYYFNFVVRNDEESYVLGLNADFSSWADLPATTGGDISLGQYYTYDTTDPSKAGFLKMWDTNGVPQKVILDLPRTGRLPTTVDAVPVNFPYTFTWTLNNTANALQLPDASIPPSPVRYSNANMWQAYLDEGKYVSPTVGYKARDRIKTNTVEDTTFILNTQRNFGWFDTTTDLGKTFDYWCYDGTNYVKVKDDIRFNATTGLEEGHSRENFLLLPIPKTADLVTGSGVNNILSPSALEANRRLQLWDIYRNKYPDKPIVTGNPDVDEANTGESEPVTTPVFLRKSTGGTSYYQTTAGLGKVYYCRKGIGIYPPGYYRVVSLNAPYYEHIRDPGPNCLVDPTRMPIRLRNIEAGVWVLDTPYFEPRKSGDVDVNPGPQAWREGVTEISDLKVWRSRLWMTSENRVFSSRLNNLYDFFSADPTQILSTDPIDKITSSDRVTNIIALQEAADSMLVITDGDTQFEITGSNNLITPETTSLEKVSNFTTNRFTKPMRIGRAVYYFSQDKLLFYYSNPQALVLVTEDLSKRVPGYLPYNHRFSLAFPAYSTLATVDELNPTDIYLNYSLIEQDKLVTNAFHKWTIPFRIHAFGSIADNEDNTWMYIVGYSDEENRLYLARINMDSRKTATSYLDYLRVTGDGSASMTYDAGTNKTLVVTRGLRTYDTITYSSDWGDDEAGEELTILNSTLGSDVNGDFYTHEIAGNHTASPLWVGKKYTSSIILQEPVMRNPQTGEFVHGLCTIQQAKVLFDRSGPFDIGISALPPATPTTVYANYNTTSSSIRLNHLLNENQSSFSEFKFLVYKPSTNLNITLSTDSPNPMNILGITYFVRFKGQNNPRVY